MRHELDLHVRRQNTTYCTVNIISQYHQPTTCTTHSRSQVPANWLCPLRRALVSPHARRIARLEALDCIRHLRPQPFPLEMLDRVQIRLEGEENGAALGQPAERLELDASISL